MRFVKRAACAVAFAACVAAVGDDAMSQAPSAVKLRVGTYNIRTMGADKGTPNAWEERKADVIALIRKLNLDAFGLQSGDLSLPGLQLLNGHFVKLHRV